tara:strand:- start:4944 stop:5318 length:375 start_codon:yes stop_codon:yes gene_type:complete
LSNKLYKLITINIILIFGLLLSLEIFSNLILRNKRFESNLEILNQSINPDWEFSFHSSVEHAHKKEDFINSQNIKSADNFNELYVVRNYSKGKNMELDLKLVALGGSTTDPLGVQFSGKNGTWP